jgi:hypothetical protein
MRLDMLRTRLFFALALALPAVAAAAPGASLDSGDQQALHDYELTPARIEKLTKIGVRMGEYVKAHPEARHSDIMKGKTLDDSVKAIQAKPEVMAMLKSEGVSPRDFMLGTLSLMQAGMLVQMRNQYPGAAMPDNTNPKNLELVASHPELTKKWMEAWEIGKARPRPAQTPPPAAQ